MTHYGELGWQLMTRGEPHLPVKSKRVTVATVLMLDTLRLLEVMLLLRQIRRSDTDIDRALARASRATTGILDHER